MPDPSENNIRKSDKSDVLSDNIIYPLPDLTYLKEMAGGDSAFVKEIITYFLENGPVLLKLLKQSALEGDHKKLHFAAHKLLPQLSFVGILGAIADIEKIENDHEIMNDLNEVIDRAIKTINFGIEDLKKMI